MPYNLDPITTDPLTEAEQKQRLKDMQREQAETLRDKLGDSLYDWLEQFDPDMDFLPDDSMEI
jgi:hypothetical protein